MIATALRFPTVESPKEFLLRMDQLGIDDVGELVDLSEEIERGAAHPHLRGARAILFRRESGTRSYVSTMRAAKRLGMDVEDASPRIVCGKAVDVDALFAAGNAADFLLIDGVSRHMLTKTRDMIMAAGLRCRVVNLGVHDTDQPLHTLSLYRLVRSRIDAVDAAARICFVDSTNHCPVAKAVHQLLRGNDRGAQASQTPNWVRRFGGHGFGVIPLTQLVTIKDADGIGRAAPDAVILSNSGESAGDEAIVRYLEIIAELPEHVPVFPAVPHSAFDVALSRPVAYQEMLDKIYSTSLAVFLWMANRTIG
jgi:hypothetical protein